MQVYNPSSLVAFKNNAGKITVSSKDHSGYGYLTGAGKNIHGVIDSSIDISKLKAGDVAFGKEFLSDYDYKSNPKSTYYVDWSTQQKPVTPTLPQAPIVSPVTQQPVQQQQQQQQTINVSGWTPTTATPTTYQPTQYTNVPTVSANTWNADKVDNAELVENRLNGLLSRDSEYMQAADARANREMARRGLLNSSLAVGNAHLAAIDRAQPIAEYDANAINQVNLSNQAAENRARSENSAATNTANTWNATAQDNANRLNNQNTNQALQIAAESANQFALANKNALDQAARDFSSAQNEASMQAAANNLKLFLAEAEQQLSQFQLESQRKTALDQIASTLIQSGLNNGVFATQEGSANWLRMIGEMYPEMGLSVLTNMSQTASAGVV